MRNIKSYQWFGLASIVLIILAFLRNNPEDVLDINIHDTYYVVTYSNILIVLCVFYILIGFFYWLLYKFKVQTSKILTKIHTCVTINAIPIYFLGNKLIKLFTSSNDSFPLFNDTSYTNVFLTILVISVGITQLLFVYNLIASLIRTKI